MCHGTALLLLGQLGPLGQGSHTTVALVWKQREVSPVNFDSKLLASWQLLC